MGTRSLAVPLLALLLASAASAQDAAVTILSPVDGAKLDAKAQNKITYDVVPGPKGDHVHVYVDEGQVALVRQLKGSYTFESLAPGSRELCIKVVDKNHTPIGVEKCVKVTVQ
jgi:hypothetical protein